MLSVSRLMNIAAIFSLCLACSKYSEKDVKDYRLHFATSEEALVDASKNLVIEFNSRLGFPALTVVGEPAEANSPVTLVRNLNAGRGMLGAGQAIAQTDQQSPVGAITGAKLHKTVTYSMKLQFDYDFFKEKASNDTNSLEWGTLFLLFCHEVGRGFMMNETYQDADKSQVMYGNINEADVEQKDYDGYFQDVRKFLGIAAPTSTGN